MSPRPRRSIILAASFALPVLSGCTRSFEQSTITSETREEKTRRPSEKPTPSPTPEPTTIRQTPKELLAFGEWYDDDSLRYTVEEIEFLSSLTTDDGSRYSVPADEKLLLATTYVKNVDAHPYAQLWGGTFVALVVGEPHHDTYWIRTASGAEIEIDELPDVDHARRWGPEGHSIYPDETVTSRFAFVVPENTSLNDLEIALNSESDDHWFPIRWRPNRT